jgi:hypothetical protein
MRWLLKEAAMDHNEIAMALADALPRDAERRTEIVAVGILVTALISGIGEEERAEMVETFCNTLRKSVAGEMN